MPANANPNTPARLSRRRFITLLGVGAGLPLLMRLGESQARPIRWEGTALGAPASISLYHTDEAQARAAIDAALRELARLEAIFSVHRADSAISTLNREGELRDAPADFLVMLERALALASISDGVYDPTVQPLWQLYFRHFTGTHPDPAGPADGQLEAALRLVDWRAVDIDRGARRVGFARPGMGLTLNSGAQGFITDRVAEVLRGHGFDRMLVDMGEPRALAPKPDGSAWRIGIANPAAPERTVATLEVIDQCVATSGGYGTLFDADGRFTHLIDTRTGRTAPAHLGVSVVAKTAAMADGLSTAMLLAPPGRRAGILRAAGGSKALYVTPQGIATVVEA